MLVRLILLLFATLSASAAERVLAANSLVTCMDNSLLDPTKFEVTFTPGDGALYYDLSLTSEISDYIVADVDVYAYGFGIISRTIDMCAIGWKQFCPVFPGVIDINSVEYISQNMVSMIPGIAYNVPDIDAIARVRVRDRTNGTEIACIQANFGNRKTVSHVGAKWATAVVAGIGLLVSAMLSTFGNSNSASHISANAVSLFIYFQSVVVVSMQHVQEVPPIAAAWCENLAWSMGLIRVTFMQKIFRWYIQATGGDPDVYFISDTVSILVQRSWDFVKRSIPFYSVLQKNYPKILSPSELQRGDLLPRDTNMYNLQGSNSILILRGIERVGYKAHIEPTSIVCTGFTFFVLCAYVLIGCFVAFRLFLKFAKKAGWVRQDRALDFSNNWKYTLKGILQRYIYIGSTQIFIFSCWEFTRNDSPAVIVLAVLFLILVVGILGWGCYRTLQFGRESVAKYNNPAAILYGDPRVLNKYGFFYTMFDARKYWFGAVVLCHSFAKCLFVAFSQSSGKTQALAIFILDLFFTGYLIYLKPYMDKLTNVVNILICVVMTVNSFLFLFFSQLFGQPDPVAAIMGWVFFILNAVFSLILLCMIIVFSCIAVFSKNPDARFAPAKDDRTSFQNRMLAKEHPDLTYDGAGELMALGVTARDHQENWAGEMHRLKEMSDSSNGSNKSEGIYNDDSPVPINETEKESFGAKLIHKLTGGKKSFKRKNQPQNDYQEEPSESRSQSPVEVKRVSDTLLNLVDDNHHRRTESSTPIVPFSHNFNDDNRSDVTGFSAYNTTSAEPVSGNDFTHSDGNGNGYMFHESPSISRSLNQR